MLATVIFYGDMVAGRCRWRVQAQLHSGADVPGAQPLGGALYTSPSTSNPTQLTYRYSAGYTARGRMVYVVNEKLGTMRVASSGTGHIKADGGNKQVNDAGTVRLSKQGDRITCWDNHSGHYGPPAGCFLNAIRRARPLARSIRGPISAD
ncbi:MAG: hypothetical protein H6707_10555 [Deltaproteobacteria bacterium]|nr:hypothetical protein [Deltaproteobacteria bacterium]